MLRRHPPHTHTIAPMPQPMAEAGDIPENVPEVEEQPPSPPAQVKHKAVPKVPVEKPAEVVRTESLALKTPAPASGPASRLSSS